MRVTEIRGYRVECRLPEPQGNASGYYDTRGSLLVQVLADDGASGWGEAWHSSDAVAATIRTQLAPVVLGADPEETSRLWAAMSGRLGYDRRGVGVMAVGAIDLALWDLRARAAGVPVARLLGGARRRAARAYAAGPYFKPGGDPYRAYAAEAVSYVRDRFRGLKMKIGIDPVTDARAVDAVRRAVGPDIAIMVDANQGYTADGALAFARRVDGLAVSWLEEPVPPDDLAGYRQVASASPVPVAGGEALSGLRAFRDFLEIGRPAVVEPDLSICGGFTEAMRIAAVADAFATPVVPHVWGTGVNLYATLQWLAVLPEMRGAGPAPYPWLEYDRSPNPLRELFGLPSLLSDGVVEIPDGPGLGVPMSAEPLAPFLVDRWTLEV